LLEPRVEFGLSTRACLSCDFRQLSGGNIGEPFRGRLDGGEAEIALEIGSEPGVLF
jgi:hypothetical protein